ncbi:MAG: fibronectin type III domain-containing protein [Opitutaceae bacterium]
MIDTLKNFATATVSTGYDADDSSIALATGHGARFGAAPFDATWWNVTDYPDAAGDPNREIVRVTEISTDTLTISRAQQGTSASTKNSIGKVYRLEQAVTAGLLERILGARPVKATLTADGYTPFLPLGVGIARIGYRVTGGTISGLTASDEGGNTVVAAADHTAGKSGLFEGEPADLYTSTFGRLQFTAGSWGGATLEVCVWPLPILDEDPVQPAAPAVPAGLSLSATDADSTDATCAAVDYAVDYEFRWSVDEENWTAGIATTTPAVPKAVTGLPAETTVYVQVRARNRVGNSDWSASETTLTAAGGGGGGSETETTAYLAKISNGSASEATIDAVVKLFKNLNGSYPLSGDLYASLRAGFIGRADCNAGTGTTLHDLTSNNRHLTLDDPTFQATHIAIASGGNITRSATSGLWPTSAAAPFGILFGFGCAYSASGGHLGTFGGNHNHGDASRVYMRDEAGSPNYIREIGAYIAVREYTATDIERAIAWCNTGSGDRLFAGGSGTAAGSNSTVRTLGDDGLRLFKRADGNFAKAGRLYYLFFFDDDISGSDYAQLFAALNSILGLSLG